jgi:signal transduction histidine kinase
LVLATYMLFGIGVALLPTVGKYRTGWQLPVHLIDIGVVSTLMYFTQRISSSIFILYVFVLMSATFRWNWRGALWTTLALPALQLILFSVTNPALDQVVIQWVFLFIIGGMFVFFGASRERNADHLTQIANWPNNRRQLYSDIEARWLDTSLRHIAAALQVPRVLVLWEIAQEPYCFSALFADGKCEHDRTTANAFGTLVSANLEGLAFAREAAGSNEYLTAQGTKQFVGPAVNETLQDRFKISSVCSAPFFGESCKGRVFILDRPLWGDEDLTLAEIVASRLHLELEYYALSIELKETAASRERIRLARDLHDGVLQTLAGAALQLGSIDSGQRIKHKLADVRELLLGEQQRIRAFIEESQASPGLQNLYLHDAMKREIDRIKRRWGCNVLLSVTPRDAAAPFKLIRQIEFLLAEAAANAVQHGNASHINITVEQLHNKIRLRIADNGRGLSGITGSYTHDELVARTIGPQSISKRIVELGGTLALSSSPNGVELCIELISSDRALEKEANEQEYALG